MKAISRLSNWWTFPAIVQKSTLLGFMLALVLLGLVLGYAWDRHHWNLEREREISKLSYELGYLDNDKVRLVNQIRELLIKKGEYEAREGLKQGKGKGQHAKGH